MLLLTYQDLPTMSFNMQMDIVYHSMCFLNLFYSIYILYMFIICILCLCVCIWTSSQSSSRDVMRMLKHVDLRYRRKCLWLTELVRRTFWRWMFLRDIIWASYKNNFMRDIPSKMPLVQVVELYELTVWPYIMIFMFFLTPSPAQTFPLRTAFSNAWRTGKENAMERGWRTNCFICLRSILISSPLMHHLSFVFFGVIEWSTLKA